MTDSARRRTTGLLLTALTMFTALAAGCSSSDGTDGPATTTASSPTYELPARPVRPDEVPLRGTPIVEGDTQFSLIGLSSGMPTLIGSHAEFESEQGQFVRIRLVVQNVGRSTVLFNTTRQLLLFADGTTAKPNEPAMLVKRQPDQFNLGANMRVEFDLYYDVAKTAKPTGLRAFGGATLTDAQDAEGTDIKLEAAHRK